VPDSLLLTKFYVPQLRPEYLSRPQLIRRLDEALGRKFTLICAPAGYGKTTLLAEWIAARPSRAATGQRNLSLAWLSLDAADSDPARFFAYLVAALRQVSPTIGRRAEVLSQAVPLPPQEALFTSIINEMVAVPAPFLLVLDDYHLITTLAVHLQMAFLVDHQPPNMHIIIATREDPPLPLAAWRARGQVAEIRQSDLQFSAEETAEFLRRAISAQLSAAQLATIQQRTEGWPAGLELLAHSLRGCADVAGQVESFAGSNRYVLDYLIEEVYQRQAPAAQDFLLQTSVLDRMSAALCDAVTGRDDSAAQLRALEQRNLFVVPLDAARQWYRYHHLFADLLRHRLEQEAPESITELQRRAGRWYADHGYPADAIHHALAACAWEDAAALILRFGDDLLKHGEIATLVGWYRALPDVLVRSQPQLCVGCAWPLILASQVDEAEHYLRLAEAASGASADRQLAGDIAAARAYIARFKGDSRRAIEQSERALALLPHDNPQRGIIALNVGLAYWYAGHLEPAEQVLAEARELCRRAGNHYAGLAAQVFLGNVHAAQGHLRLARAEYEQACEQGGETPLAALAHAALAKLLYDRNELAAAAAHAEQALALSRRSGQPEYEITAARVLALVQQARGETAAAQEALSEIEQLTDSETLSPTALRHALAFRILVALLAGNLVEARRLADSLPGGEEGGSMPDYVYLSLAQARLLLAENRRKEAVALLEQREAILTRAGFVAARIDTCALRALAASTPEEARAHLAEALSLAEHEGYMRPFLDLGEPMAALLHYMAAQGVAVAQVGRLLAAFRMAARGRSADAVRNQPLVEPLSARELEVLRLLAAGQTNAEIGRALYVSANTVKAHLRNIYRKLDVTTRRAAAANAKQLGLL
jgi:LuxR family maltose regulon positive regulatory protein